MKDVWASKKCGICETVFLPHSSNAKYCCDTCRGYARRKRERYHNRTYAKKAGRAAHRTNTRDRPEGFVAEQFSKARLSLEWKKPPVRTYPCPSCGHGHRTELMVRECAEIYRRWGAVEDALSEYRIEIWGDNG